MELLIVKNEVIKPQDDPEPQKKFNGVDVSGSIKEFDLKEEFGKKYIVLLFLRLETEIDFEDVAYLMKEKKSFEDIDCQMVGVTSASPLAIKMFMENEFGGKLSFPILSDKAMDLSMQFGVGLTSGFPVKSTIILDKTMQVRFIQTQRVEIKRGVGEIARLVAAYQFSDETEQALAAGWTPGCKGGIIPCDVEGKNKYYRDIFPGYEGREESEGSDKKKMKTEPVVKKEASYEISVEEKEDKNEIDYIRVLVGLFLAILTILGIVYLINKYFYSESE